MSMWLEELVWDEDNIGHIARHGVSARETEEVVFDPATMTAQSRTYPTRTLFVGLTEAGKFLTVVIARIGDAQGRVITARPASRKERDAYKEWRDAE